MKKLLAVAVLSIMAVGNIGPAHAEGCIKGAVVGGIAGHLVHHGILGAVAGCAVGHHEAKVARERREEEQRQTGQSRD